MKRFAALSAALIAIALPSLASASSFAVVDAAGGVKHAKDVSSASRAGVGIYNVTFNRDVSSCVYMGVVSAPSFGIVATSLLPASTTTVQVRTQTATGASGSLTDLPFNLQVNCAGDGLWASVNTNGTIAARSDPSITTSGGFGVTQVVFPADMTSCAGLMTDTGPGLGLFTTHHGHDLGATSISAVTKNMGYGVSGGPFQISATCGPSALWAVVTHDGVLVRGGGVTGVSRSGAGQYVVSFNRDVTDCAPVATHGYAGTASDVLFVPPLVAAAPSAALANAVSVQTRIAPFTDPAVNFIDKPFHLVVVCNPLLATPSSPTPPAPVPPAPPVPPAQPAPPAQPKAVTRAIDADVRLTVRLVGGSFQIVRLRVTRAEKGARIAIKCKKGCSLSRVSVLRGKTQTFTTLFGGRKLRTGSTIEIRITKANRIGKYVRYRITRSDLVGTECNITTKGKLTRCAPR